MELPLLSRIRVASMFGRSPDAAEAVVWTLGIAAAALLTWWLTGRASIAAVVGSLTIVLAAWRCVKILTALRRSLAEAQQTWATMEQALASMEQALARSQKMEAMGRLTTGVAHDFNNHLTVISNNVELIARRLGEDQQRLLGHTDAAMQGVRRAAILTGRLLSFSCQPAVEPEMVEVDRLVHGLSDTAAADAGRAVRAAGAAVPQLTDHRVSRRPPSYKHRITSVFGIHFWL